MSSRRQAFALPLEFAPQALQRAQLEGADGALALVHDPRAGSFDAWLIRTARGTALKRREAQSPVSSVHPSEATPRSLVEAAFFGGMSASELSRMYAMSEDEVRRRLCNGMAELRTEFITAPR